MLISSENVEKIKELTEQIKDTTVSVRSVNDLNIAIKDFEYSTTETIKQVSFLKYQIGEKDNEINHLKKELSTKEKIISKLLAEKDTLKEQLQKFKGFWYDIMKHFQKKLGFHKDEHYKYVTDDLYKNGIFKENEKEIAINYSRKVRTQDEINTLKDKKKNNRELR